MLALEVCLKLSLKKIRVIKFNFWLNYKKKAKKGFKLLWCYWTEPLQKKIIKHCIRKVKELILTVQSQPGFKYENSLYFLASFAFASCLQNEPQMCKVPPWKSRSHLHVNPAQILDITHTFNWAKTTSTIPSLLG